MSVIFETIDIIQVKLGVGCTVRLNPLVSGYSFLYYLWGRRISRSALKSYPNAEVARKQITKWVFKHLKHQILPMSID